MRAGTLLLIVAALIIAAAWNAGAVLDASIALYSWSPARTAIGFAWGAVGFCLGAMGLAMLSKRAYRQIEQDFPESTGIGAADIESVKRNERI